ncbi:hypothetical protein ZHAS_00019580 [Anopheles sinensis]|uniref:Uncharacterized protein n=1 Tax=Anopheles sinensis TaxID=74873 RepID=A0A084WMS5_ANOSI|nr:hypothetical protein ZHAS_00019580 [Anopheles sinensis]
MAKNLHHPSLPFSGKVLRRRDSLLERPTPDSLADSLSDLAGCQRHRFFVLSCSARGRLRYFSFSIALAVRPVRPAPFSLFSHGQFIDFFARQRLAHSRALLTFSPGPGPDEIVCARTTGPKSFTRSGSPLESALPSAPTTAQLGSREGKRKTVIPFPSSVSGKSRTPSIKQAEESTPTGNG